MRWGDWLGRLGCHLDLELVVFLLYLWSWLDAKFFRVLKESDLSDFIREPADVGNEQNRLYS